MSSGAVLRSGTVISRTSVSSTCAPAPSTDRRSVILPGLASKVTRDGTRSAAAVDGAVAVAPTGTAEASAMSGTRPRKNGAPSVPIAMTDTRAGSSRAGGEPGDFGMASQTKVTRVLPLSPRDVPTQVRTTSVRDGRLMAASAFSTGFGAMALGAALAIAAS